MESLKNDLEGNLEKIVGNIIDESSFAAYIGIITITRRSLEKLKSANRKAKIKMAGILIFSKDVTSDLVRETIESVKVRGIIKAPARIKEILKEL